MKRIPGESELETAARNLVYIVCCKTGIRWLALKLGMELRPQYKLRDNDPNFWEQYE